MNNSPSPVPINMELMAFGPLGTSGEAAISNFTSGNPDAGFVTFSPDSFSAQPKVWSKVKVTIKLPASASLGYYYAIIFQPVYAANGAKDTNSIHNSNAILALINTNSG